MNKETWRTIAGVVALVLWISSLVLPAVTLCSPPGSSIESWPGGFVLIFGWLGPTEGQFGWYANLTMLWMSLRLIFRYRAGLAPGLIGLCLALTSFSWTGIRGDGPPATICQHNSGFFVWIVCAVFLCAFALVERFLSGATTKNPVEALPLSDNDSTPPHHSESDVA